MRNRASEKGSHLYCRVVGWRIASSVVGRANSKMRADPADLSLNNKNSFAFFDLVRNRGYGTGIEDRYAHERVVVIVQFVSHT